jgi:predicted transcriptional regulator
VKVNRLKLTEISDQLDSRVDEVARRIDHSRSAATVL